jgi:hypothetical protein
MSMLHKKNIFYGGLSLLLCSSISLRALNIPEVSVFGKWHASQQVLVDQNLTTLSAKIASRYPQAFKGLYEKNINLLAPVVPFFAETTNSWVSRDGYSIPNETPEAVKTLLGAHYLTLETNLPAWVEYMQKSAFLQPENTDILEPEKPERYNTVINRYKASARLLLGIAGDEIWEQEYMLSLANRFFEYQFSPTTAPHYQRLFGSAASYPLLRFINVITWDQLVGQGWKHWHEKTLTTLKHHASQQGNVTYLAGGSDIYQLLRNTVYNIKVIDPFLPTQERYYSEGWKFLISANENQQTPDTIQFGPECNSISMKRLSHEEGEPFTMKLSSGEVANIKKSTTTWTVNDRNGTPRGSVVFERRPVTQTDFSPAPNTAIVMSYDEAVYSSLPDSLNGWGINSTEMDTDLKIYIKQLRSPITPGHLNNIRIAAMLNASDLRFINLASDPT